MIANGALSADNPILPEQIQPASLDLRLGTRAWRVRASFLAGRNRTVKERLGDFQMHAVDLTGGAPEMNPHFRYLVESLKERGVTHIIDRCNLINTLILRRYCYYYYSHRRQMGLQLGGGTLIITVPVRGTTKTKKQLLIS